MWDFCLVGTAGEHIGSLEVTRHTDPDLRAFSEDLYSQGSVREAPDYLQSSWIVQLEAWVRPKRFKNEKLFEILLDAERLNVEHLLPRYGYVLSEQTKALGVHYAHRSTLPRGKIFVTGPSTGWFGEGHVSRGVVDEAAANAAKLQDAPVPRHLYVWIDYAAIPAMTEMTMRGPGPDPVQLPSFVDVAWAACGEANLGGAALWRATRGHAWEVLREFSA